MDLLSCLITCWEAGRDLLLVLDAWTWWGLLTVLIFRLGKLGSPKWSVQHGILPLSLHTWYCLGVGSCFRQLGVWPVKSRQLWESEGRISTMVYLVSVWKPPRCVSWCCPHYSAKDCSFRLPLIWKQLPSSQPYCSAADLCHQECPWRK